MFNLLPPATKLRQGYVFTGICDSVHRGEGGSAQPPWWRLPRVGHTLPIWATSILVLLYVLSILMQLFERKKSNFEITITGTIGFFTVCTKFAEMAILYSKDLTTAKKKLPPEGLDLMLQIITGLGVQCLARWAKQVFAYKFKTFRSLCSIDYS